MFVLALLLYVPSYPLVCVFSLGRRSLLSYVPGISMVFDVQTPRDMSTPKQAQEFIISVIKKQLLSRPVFLDEIQLCDPDLLTCLIYVRTSNLDHNMNQKQTEKEKEKNQTTHLNTPPGGRRG
jgi:hypothetical protein